MHKVSAVFGKEMITLARRKRHYLARALVLGSLLAVIAVTWRETTRYAPVDVFADLAGLGRSLFGVFAIAQLVMVLLIAPALTAPVVAAERERDTLGLLLLTNLAHRSILLDKLLSRVALVSLLILAGLPVVFVLLAFRGVEPMEILLVYVVTFSALFFCCGVGLRVSTRSTTVRGALIGAYLATALASGAVLPLGMILLIVLGSMGLIGSFDAAVIAATVMCALLSWWVFTSSVRKCAAILPAMAEAKRVSWWQREMARLRESPRRRNLFSRVVLRRNALPNRHPLFWRELHAQVNTSRLFIFFWCYTLTFLLYGFYIVWSWSPDYAAVISSMHLAAVVLLAIILSATAFGGEKDKHALDPLLCTPQRDVSFVACKFVGVVRSIAAFAVIPLLLPLLGLIPAFRQDGWRWLQGLLLLAAMMVVFLPPVILIGLWFGVRCARSGTAIAWTFISFAVWALGPFVLLFLMDAPDMTGTWRDGVQYLSPVGWLMGVFRTTPEAGLFHAVLPALAASGLLFMILVGRFDRTVGRL